MRIIPFLILPLALLMGCGDDAVVTATPADGDGDGYSIEVDCDDAHAEVNPAAAEVCDGLDNNCDGEVDNDATDAPAFFADGDGDGVGTGEAVHACQAPEGHVEADGDCDDSTPTVHPGAPELCNGIDDNCDGALDGDPLTLYADADGDGYGAGEPITACEASAGFVALDGDCDDASPGVNPGASEVCNGMDDDCDTVVDNGVLVTMYPDLDGDGYGDSATSIMACPDTAGYAAADGDCNEADSAINPGAADLCDTIDNDCNDMADDGGDCPCNVEYHAGKPYLFCSQPADWDGAQAACHAVGYQLITMSSVDENDWAMNLAQVTYGWDADATMFWMGFNDRDAEGTFVWASGEAVSFTDWGAAEPNNGGGVEDCAVTRTLGDWNDITCTGVPESYVCEP